MDADTPEPASSAPLQPVQRPALYVVSTPIGNLLDMTPRALDVLAQADFVLAEDTRVFRKLASHFRVHTPARSFHDHNEAKMTPQIMDEIRGGACAALVSDSGTPLISDPGYRLVSACRAAGLPVLPVPGACAAIAALSVSGMEVHRFSFDGFLPVKPGKRSAALEEILSRDHTTILYESPHKIEKTLAEIAKLDPMRTLFVARELTKLHEECLRGTAEEVLHAVRKNTRGEFVVIIGASAGEREV